MKSRETTVITHLDRIRGLSRMSALLLLPLLSASWGEAAARVVEREVRLSAHGFATTPLAGGAVRVSLDRGLVRGSAGEPEIPELVIRVALPAGESVLWVELLPLETRVLGPGLAVSPVGAMSERGPLETLPDAEAYASTAWVPEPGGSARTSGYREGHRIESVVLSPVSYRGSTGELRVMDRFRVRLHVGPRGTEAMARRLRAPRTSRASRESRVRESVDWYVTGAGRWAESEQARGSGSRVTSRPSLEGSGVDLVIVAPEALASAYAPLAEWKTSTGLRTEIRTLEWIVSTYEAADVPARVRAFLRDAYVHWGIEYAILGGDTDVLPVSYVHSRYSLGDEGAQIASDYYMACLDGDWNADGDHLLGEGPRSGLTDDDADLEPDIYVGRLPANTVAEAELLANKSMWYMGADPSHFDDTYQETISFYAEALVWSSGSNGWNGVCDFPDLFIDGGDFAADVYDASMPDRYRANTLMYFESEACWTDPPFTVIAEDRGSVIADFNSGRHFVVHIGHGFRNNMAVGASTEKLFNADADAFTNGDRTSILYAINCNSGAIDFDAIGEHFLLNHRANGNGGIVALVAATDLDYALVSRRHLDWFFAHVLPDSEMRLGELFFEGIREEYASHAATQDNASRWTLYSLILLGDPSLRTWSALPERFSVDAPLTYEMGSGAYVVTVLDDGTGTPVPGALVTAYKSDDTHVTAFTDAGGVAMLPFEPASPGAFTLGVDRPGYVPTVEPRSATAPLASPHLVVSGQTVAELSGNGDGVPDAGEAITMSFSVRNAGGGDATNVGLVASTTGTDVVVLQGNAGVGNVGAGAEVVSGTIELQLADALSPEVSFVDAKLALELSGDSATWVRQVDVRIGAARVAHVGLDAAEITGNGDSVPDGGERWSVTPTLWNGGAGRLVAGSVELVALDDAVVLDAPVAIDPPACGVASAQPITFDVGGAPPSLELVYRDGTTELTRVSLNFTAPDPPAVVWPVGGVDAVRLNWEPSASADVLGYNVYSELEGRGATWERLNVKPAGYASFSALGLQPLTSFRFAVASVDSAGNEGAWTSPIVASTSPPLTTGFPVTLTGSENRGSPTYVDLDQDGVMKELIVGSDYVYVVRGDGKDYIDGDGEPLTLGVFSGAGHVPGEPVRVFWSKAAVADIDLDGTLEILIGHLDSAQLYCFDANGELEWGGGSHKLGQNLWSSPALGNIDDDPELEVVLWSGANGGAFRGALVAFNHDGTEVINGDGNPATNGVFAVSPNPDSQYNYGSVAIHDLDGDGVDEIVAGERFGSDGWLYVVELVNGLASVKDGWPYDPTGGGHQFTSSPAVADADDDGSYEIYATSRRGLHALSMDGTLRPGYPHEYTPSTVVDFNDFLPSPLLGDFNGDGELDVLHGWAEGFIYAYTAETGVALPGFPVQIDIDGQDFDRVFLNGSLANVDSDPEPELVIGTGGGELYAINADGSVVGGFPYPLGGAIFGAPAVWDMDRDGNTDIVFTGSTGSLISLEMTGVPAVHGTSPWPQWRHDPRNSGVYGSGLGTVPIDVGTVSVTALGPSRISVAWRASGRYDRFLVERAAEGETRTLIATVSANAGDDRYRVVDVAAPAGRFVRYWVVGERGTAREEVGPYGVFVPAAPAVTRLLSNAPNPFNPITSIRYDIGGGAERVVRLSIYDISGRLVRDLVDDVQPQGAYAVSWDGRDRAGRLQSSGVYVYRLEVGDLTFSRKLVLAK